MKKILLLLLALCAVPAVALSQSVDCPNCEMGIYDSSAMVANFGRFDGASKEVFLGVKFDPAVATGLTGVEVSVLGLAPFFISFQASAGVAVEIGSTIMTPPDLQDATGGGKNLAWATCQSGSNGQYEFGKITMISLTGPGTVGDDIVLTIERKYPASNVNNQFAHFTQCDNPFYTATKTTNGCYVINPTGGAGDIIGGCELKGTAVENRDWTGVKELFR